MLIKFRAHNYQQKLKLSVTKTFDKMTGTVNSVQHLQLRYNVKYVIESYYYGVRISVFLLCLILEKKLLMSFHIFNLRLISGL